MNMTGRLLPRRISRQIQFRAHPALTACWFWIGSTDSNGYPTTSYEGVSTSVRMAVYRILTGRSPFALKALCQQQLCVNPHHMREAKSKGEKP